MSSTHEHATSCLLYAILKQVDVKDIDWERVAQDPCMPQPISNGHAARMRFARCRAAMTRFEEGKQARPVPGQVTKRRRTGSSERNCSIKSEPTSTPNPPSQTPPYLNALHTPQTYQQDFGPRVLTPDSDEHNSRARKLIKSIKTKDPGTLDPLPPVPPHMGAVPHESNQSVADHLAAPSDLNSFCVVSEHAIYEMMQPALNQPALSQTVPQIFVQDVKQAVGQAVDQDWNLYAAARQEQNAYPPIGQAVSQNGASVPAVSQNTSANLSCAQVINQVLQPATVQGGGTPAYYSWFNNWRLT